MLEEYLGLAGMLAIGIGAALGLYGLASRLRSKLGLESTAAMMQAEGAEPERDRSSARSSSRYFFIAIVGLTLHAGSFYFYLWGASDRRRVLLVGSWCGDPCDRVGSRDPGRLNEARHFAIA
ncbi:MAG: hypothetical protein JRG94_04780 [Deltaproteobacteria bacterium]|nr:hypothetical protein [Deltaproteobacteria bacterium]